MGCKQPKRFLKKKFHLQLMKAPGWIWMRQQWTGIY